MRFLRSAPAQGARVGAARFAVAFGAGWIAPSALGLGLLLVQKALVFAPDLRLTVALVALLLLYSPIFSWMALLLGAPAVVWLVRRGWFGWPVALGLGAALGAGLAAALGGMGPAVGPALGLMGGGAVWGSLRLMLPDVFGTGRDSR